MPLTEVLERWGGAASSRQLRAAGVSQRVLGAAVAAGTVLRPRNGRYVAPGATEPMMRAVASGARLSCVSAARSYGLWAGTDGRTHLVVPPTSGRAGPGGCGVVRHWRACEDHPEIWRVSLRDCLRTVVRCSDAETAVAVLDTAISAGFVSASLMQTFFLGEPRRSRELAREARPGSESGVESILRQRLTARGHWVEQQVHVRGVGRIDARVDGVLYVEVDGFAFHSDRVEFERDRARDTALTLAGMRRLRFSARQVIDDPAGAADTVEAALEMLKREEQRAAAVG